MLFPKTPRLVRLRKLQMLLWLISLSILAAAVLGLLFFLANRYG